MQLVQAAEEEIRLAQEAVVSAMRPVQAAGAVAMRLVTAMGAAAMREGKSATEAVGIVMEAIAATAAAVAWVSLVMEPEVWAMVGAMVM